MAFAVRCQVFGDINGRGSSMLVGYVCVSKPDGFQSTDVQRDALVEAGVD